MPEEKKVGREGWEGGGERGRGGGGARGGGGGGGGRTHLVLAFSHLTIDHAFKTGVYEMCLGV